MFKRLFVLNGLAILAVVCSHTAVWGAMAMVWWTDRWRPVSVPNYDMYGTLPYYLLLIQRKLAHFSVPAFLFFSGFFLIYAASGSATGLSWKAVRVRVQTLFIPFLIWSAVRIALGLVAGKNYSLAQVVSALLLGWPLGVLLWYPPIICFFYLVSPFLIRFARVKPYLLLVIAGLVHLAAIGYEYVRLGLYFQGISVPNLDALLPRHLLFAFFFVLGLVVGIRRKEFAAHLKGRAWYLLVLAIAMGAMAVIESEVVYRSTSTSIDWSISNATLPTTLFVLAFILLFLAMGDIPKSIAKIPLKLGASMYGIYLLHGFIVEFSARATQRFAPGVLAFPIVFQVLLVISAVAGSMLIMTAVQRTPLRRYSKYLFG